MDQNNTKNATIAKEEVVPAKPGGLGTFGGVFTPSILTILGVIMYLRFGWVVANVGLFPTLIIVTLATSITFLTALSVSEIATDQRVRAGGAYYMVSRSLGIELGGAIGIPLYFAQGLSVALYTIGFSESVVAVFPQFDIRVVGVITTLLVTVLCLTSAQAAIRAQYLIMGAIALSLLSLIFGHSLEPAEVGYWSTSLENPASFWTVFAVFFPAVTGIMAGVNMSGDLADPAHSIPKGTFAAVGTGYLIYMLLPILLVFRASAERLAADPLIMREMALWGDAILLGIWGATLSSAVGSMLGAPRVLQAIARDGILPNSLRWLGRGSGKEDTPRLGTLLTLAITLVAVLLGDLNLIAPVLSMFFLTTYGILNIAAGLERFLGSPSFRPKFSVHWSLSLLGALGCIAVMFLINPIATIIAFIFVGGIYVWLERRTLEAAWGDVRQGLWMAITRASLLRLRGSPDPKNWRPHLLVLSGAPMRRWHLIDFAVSLSHNRALMTVATVLPRDAVTTERQQSIEMNIKDYLERRGVQSMVRLVLADDTFQGSEQLVETYGLGSLMPNTVVLGDSEGQESRTRYCEMITHFYASQRNVAVVRYNEALGFGQRKQIDVWWGGLKGNGSLMMILAYLLRTSLQWPGAQVRVRMIVPTEQAVQPALTNLRQIIHQIRIMATADIIVANGRSFADIVHEASQETDLIFMGMAVPNNGDFKEYYTTLSERLDGLPTTVLVLAAEEIAFRKVLLQQEH